MQSVVIQADGDVCVEQRPMPKIEEGDQVLIRVVYSGLCGSDIPRIFYKGAHYYPIILGHEFSGYVQQCGETINDLQPGDKVACVPLRPCFHCPECCREYFSLCKNYQFIGSRSTGGNCEFIVLPRENVFKLPEKINFKYGAFIEPITVGLHAYHLCGGCEGKVVIIVGAGTIGLLALQSARELGARAVIAVDIDPGKLSLAKRLGASYVFNSCEMDVNQIRQLLNDQRFEQLILETAGTPQTVALVFDIAGPRAQIALVGTLHYDLQLPAATFGHILRKELTITGSWMNYSGPWPGEEWHNAARMLSEERYDLAPLIAHTGDAQSFAQQVKALQGQPMQGKILLHFPLNT